MKVISMVLAAALMPAAALASPNNNDQQNDQQSQTQSSETTQSGSSAGMQGSQSQGVQGSQSQGMQGSQSQQTVEVEAFEWSTGQGRLGLMLMALTPQLRTYFGAPNASGLLVAQVAPNSPAARAGVKVGDVITQVENKNVQGADDIIAATSDIGTNTGSSGNANKVPIKVIRNHKPMNLQAMIGAGSTQSGQSGMNQSGQSGMNESGTVRNESVRSSQPETNRGT